jgi:hypothetical protein
MVDDRFHIYLDVKAIPSDPVCPIKLFIIEKEFSAIGPDFSIACLVTIIATPCTNTVGPTN